MSLQTRPFKATSTTAASLACTTTTGRVALSAPFANANFQVMLHNAGSSLAFVNFGDATVTATTANIPIPAGAVVVLTIQGVTNMAGITASGTATLYATTGEGV